MLAKQKLFIPDISLQEARALLAVDGGADVWDYALAMILRGIERRGFKNLLDITKPQMFRGSGSGKTPYIGAFLKTEGKKVAVAVMNSVLGDKSAAAKWLRTLNSADKQTLNTTLNSVFLPIQKREPGPTVIHEWSKWRIMFNDGKYYLQYNSAHTMGAWLDHCDRDPIPSYVKIRLHQLEKA